MSIIKQRSASPKVVSELYGIPIGTLANLRWKKEGAKFYKRGRAVVYYLEDIESWLRSAPVLTADAIENQ